MLLPKMTINQPFRFDVWLSLKGRHRFWQDYDEGKQLEGPVWSSSANDDLDMLYELSDA